MGLATGETMGEGAFLTSLGVILVPVVARIVFKEITPLATWMALPVAILGLVLLSSQHGFRISTAQSYYLVAASLFACFYALNTRATNAEVQQHPVHPLAMTTILMFMASLVTGAASLAFESQHWSKIDISSILVVWVLASAIIGTALRFLMQTYAQSLTQSTNGAVILVIEPIWVVLFSAFWFAERLSLLQLIGCSFILAALLVNRWNVITTGIKKWKR